MYKLILIMIYCIISYVMIPTNYVFYLINIFDLLGLYSLVKIIQVNVNIVLLRPTNK